MRVKTMKAKKELTIVAREFKFFSRTSCFEVRSSILVIAVVSSKKY